MSYPRHRRQRGRATRSQLLAVLAAAVLLAGTGWLAAAFAPRGPNLDVAAAGNGGPPPPAHGAALGALVEPQQYDQAGRTEAVRSFEADLGRPLAIVHVYVRWARPLATASTLGWARSGRQLLVSWATTDIRQIASGHEDGTIATMAKQVKRLGVPLFLEPRWEMDRPNLSSVVHSAREFVAAWDRIRLIFAVQQVTNVSWVWCPTAKGFATHTAPAYYPGDDEVDWVCADAYPLSPSTSGGYEPLSDLLAAFLTWAAGHGKPVMIGEFGVPLSYGDRRAAWLEQAARYVRTHPEIKALVYYDGPARRTNPIADYWLQSDPAAMRAFADLARDPYFGGQG